MIRISAGEKLPFEQKDITLRGHSIECRISAEDPDHGFRPCAGTVTNLYLPGGNGVRVDSMLYQGCRIPPYYDSMLAKIIVHGATRREAARKMQRALGELVIEGIHTNLDFQYELVGTKAFEEGDSAAINERISAILGK
jgi:acetyl-CoA carboxylase biotin carboxylase subunit